MFRMGVSSVQGSERIFFCSNIMKYRRNVNWIVGFHLIKLIHLYNDYDKFLSKRCFV